MNMKNVIEYLPVDKSFTKHQFSSLVRETNANYSESSISWLLSELKKEHKIASIGRGVYIRITEESPKKEYYYDHLEKYLKIEQTISREFPLVGFQMWEMYQLNEFVNHLFGKNTIFVEVENMCEAPVFEMLHESFPNVLFCPNKDMYYRQRGNDDTIVVQKLISEAPKPVMGHSVLLEKLLVDLFSKKLTGRLISQSEYQGIYEEAFSRYNIDEIKMFRYARRRHLETEIKTFLKEKTNVVMNYPAASCGVSRPQVQGQSLLRSKLRGIKPYL
ncbi:MAG: hypothetical protein NC092_11450 [Butyrivibrio sp.]|nr:hypothetical protein [Muribaculum sp.]MCM1553297.1 hypothetical protein [Butyrivibrio sp.]